MRAIPEPPQPTMDALHRLDGVVASGNLSFLNKRLTEYAGVNLDSMLYAALSRNHNPNLLLEFEGVTNEHIHTLEELILDNEFGDLKALDDLVEGMSDSVKRGLLFISILRYFSVDVESEDAK